MVKSGSAVMQELQVTPAGKADWKSQKVAVEVPVPWLICGPLEPAALPQKMQLVKDCPPTP